MEAKLSFALNCPARPARHGLKEQTTFGLVVAAQLSTRRAIIMRKICILSVAAAVLISSGAFAQAPAPTNPPAASKADAGPKLPTPHWRSSKLIGVKVYNDQNESLGDISEIILDQSGKVLGYVVGVGGFLGMGEHDIFVEPNKIKFVNEPLRTTAAPASGTKTATKTDAQPSNTRPVSNTAPRAANEQWYPDHAMLSATKDQLKSMPQFKYSNYN
jgi:hypothetical protein